MKKSLYFGIVTFVVAMSFAFIGCSDKDDDTEPDKTAPTLTAGTTTGLSESGATVKFTSNEAGTYYYLVYLASVTEGPSKEVVKAQKDGTDVKVKGSGSATTSETSIEVSGLDANTSYKAYIIVEDAAGNQSKVLAITFATTNEPDSRSVLTAVTGSDQDGNTVDAHELTATAKFTSAAAIPAGVTLSATDDFTITASDGSSAPPANTVSISPTIGIDTARTTVTVTVTFAETNATTSAKAFTVGINSNSVKIKNPSSGATTVTVTQKVDDVIPGISDPALTFDSVTDDSLVVKWTKATDNISAAADLTYFVYTNSSAFSGSTNAELVASIEDGDLENTGGTANIAELEIEDLTSDTTYYVAVIVEDEKGNKAAYTQSSKTTKKAKIEWEDGDPAFSGTSAGVLSGTVTATLSTGASFDTTNAIVEAIGSAATTGGYTVTPALPTNAELAAAENEGVITFTLSTTQDETVVTDTFSFTITFTDNAFTGGVTAAEVVDSSKEFTVTFE
ncbi:MAG: fibronectin type III domain-containing protein [Treponema sp.]|jgi:hypothetical protein|nr:fibronectin type III domain-containing protein [Treponema sp.]